MNLYPIGMHFDADYGLEEQFPTYTLHPRCATITYLSDAGVPTLILDKRSPSPNDPEKQSLNGSINNAWLSHPYFGKHVAFDGRYLHGAPGEYFPSVAKKYTDTSEPSAKKVKVDENDVNTFSGKRVTFLVNIWLNHCPLESELLEDELLDKMTTPWEDDAQSEGTAKGLKSDESYRPPFEWNVNNIDTPDMMNNTTSLSKVSETGEPAGVEEAVICNRHVDILFGASMEDFHNASKLAASADGGSMPIQMENDVISLKVGKEVSSDGEDEE